MYKIEKNIPIQEHTRRGELTEFVSQLNVGDSFLIPLEGEDTIDDIRQKANSLVTSGRRQGKKLTSRSVGNGLRVWRVS